MVTIYSPTFYRTYRDESYRSAAVVAPLVMEMVGPRRVLDVGCGIGTWLAAFGESGAVEIRGVDGAYVDQSLLRIPPDRFTPLDLGKELAIDGAPFDLAVSLEVAEHLPQSRAASFVADITRHAPVVLFSAAIPFQGGDHHVNEQWLEYWVELYARNGYVAIDCIRPRVWDDERVAYYYAQNTLLYVHADRLPEYPRLMFERNKYPDVPRSCVHPRKWREANDPCRQPLPPLLKALPLSASRALSLRWGRVTGRKTQ